MLQTVLLIKKVNEVTHYHNLDAQHDKMKLFFPYVCYFDELYPIYLLCYIALYNIEVSHHGFILSVFLSLFAFLFKDFLRIFAFRCRRDLIVFTRAGRISRAMCNAHVLRRLVELDREKRLWERYECITLTGIAVAVRRGSCFIPVIRRLSRGLYLSQLLGVNHSELFHRLFSCLISDEFLQQVRKSSIGKRKREEAAGDPFIKYHRSLLFALFSL